MNRLTLFDSTLRDGAQGQGISFSVSDKLNILRLLDEAGIPYIEAGNPFSNPKDRDFFQKAGEVPLKQARLVAFGSTRKPGTAAEEDPGLAGAALRQDHGRGAADVEAHLGGEFCSGDTADAVGSK